MTRTRVTKLAVPGPVRPRTKPAEVRREELMDAAERIFLRKGIGATSVDEIVLAADVAKGTFYLHFESKEQLLSALQERFVTRFSADVAAAIGRRRVDDWKGRLRAFIAAVVACYTERAALHALVFHEFRPDGPREKHQNPIIEQLAEFLSEGVRAGVFTAESPHLTAAMLFHALHGVFDDAVDATEKPKQRIRSLEAFFYRALGVDAGRRP